MFKDISKELMLEIARVVNPNIDWEFTDNIFDGIEVVSGEYVVQIDFKKEEIIYFNLELGGHLKLSQKTLFEIFRLVEMSKASYLVLDDDNVWVGTYDNLEEAEVCVDDASQVTNVYGEVSESTFFIYLAFLVKKI